MCICYILRNKKDFRRSLFLYILFIKDIMKNEKKQDSLTYLSNDNDAALLFDF